MPRIQPPRDPVRLHFDGEEIEAERGEPVAVALVAAGHLALARSPKFHRPRGPYCQRGACDGCLARVDDVPNVMTCRTPAVDGMRIATQNVVGSRDYDLLGMADWFFPSGMNHHELFAGVPGVQQVMQAFARRVAGLGKLPKEPRAPREASRRDADVLVVGAGPSGMATAVRLSERGRKVEVVDDDLAWGGCVRSLVGVDAAPWQPLVQTFGATLVSGRVVLRLGTTAAGIYGGDVLVAGDDGVEVVTPRTLVLAPGAHDGVVAFEGNDAPGVMSARAAGRLLGYGVVPGERIVVVVTERGGPFGEAFVRAHPAATLVRGTPVASKGSGRVKEWTLATPAGEQRLKADVLLVDTPRAPAYELCAQAGGALVHEERGFLVHALGGRIRDGVFAVGEVVGTPLDPTAVANEAMAVAEQA
jgi:sarcosine oxidase subunit alpha